MKMALSLRLTLYAACDDVETCLIDPNRNDAVGDVKEHPGLITSRCRRTHVSMQKLKVWWYYVNSAFTYAVIQSSCRIFCA